jgi:hypothetical protein
VRLLDLACRGFSSLCEVRFDLLVLDGGAGIALRFLDFGAEPVIVCGVSDG